ncbi:hypothetical protein QE450_000034 [Paenibacillus sp. SORGH_AS306]|uniref:pre-toxin TG domain-containing protein n=1 Tax=unclassified Paenibacillus TaxID=185978 RepID=UPI00277EE3E2|nr:MULTISPECIES: pre-toxin TG domain-containing protein [unclassified Paenibacillus]MDQ1232536.1 hypothetical protein [Paenibacillus sp. SORGH_AS_0306]MDR6109586.1 hypothetical protein [Paenibacillus sp. SORGH_AS_0338]
MNRYAYVNGTPISYIDSFGLSADGHSWFATGLSYGADAIRYVRTVKGIQETISGVNYITGEQRSVGERIANGVTTLKIHFLFLVRNPLEHNILLDVRRA